jgi:hypothetical protein
MSTIRLASTTKSEARITKPITTGWSPCWIEVTVSWPGKPDHYRYWWVELDNDEPLLSPWQHQGFIEDRPDLASDLICPA